MFVKSTSILLADDDIEDQDILIWAISQFEPEATIKTVVDGTDVIQYLEDCSCTELPAIIILDYKMPILGAAGVLDKIGKDPRYKNIIKIVLSTSLQPVDVRICLERGASHYFQKACNVAELNELVRQVLAMRETPDFIL